MLWRVGCCCLHRPAADVRSGPAVWVSQKRQVSGVSRRLRKAFSPKPLFSDEETGPLRVGDLPAEAGIKQLPESGL